MIVIHAHCNDWRAIRWYTQSLRKLFNWDKNIEGYQMKGNNKYCLDYEYFQDKINFYNKREGVYRCQAEFSDHKGAACLPFDDTCSQWKEASQ